MRPSTPHPLLQYAPFLFEPLGDDSNGAPLALASILGRMSLDPWKEAAALAALPAFEAVRKLASFLEAAPNHVLAATESNKLAERLIKLLPAQRNAPNVPTGPPRDGDPTNRHPLGTYVLWTVLVVGIVFVGASLF